MVPLLSKAEVDRFNERGFGEPFDLLPEDVAERVGSRIVEEVLAVRSPIYAHSQADIPKLLYIRDRHLDSPVLARLFSDGAIVRRLTSILGPNVLLWRSDFFVQGTDDRETMP